MMYFPFIFGAATGDKFRGERSMKLCDLIQPTEPNDRGKVPQTLFFLRDVVASLLPRHFHPFGGDDREELDYQITGILAAPRNNLLTLSRISSLADFVK